MSYFPPLFTLLPLFTDEKGCIEYLYHRGAFYKERKCVSCGKDMHYKANVEFFICRGRGCRKKVSLKANSFFGRHKLTCCQILHLGYCWITKCSVQTAMKHTGHTIETVCNFYRHFRQLIANSCQLEDSVVGGEGRIG